MGGAMYLSQIYNLSIQDSIFHQNMAIFKGGSIAILEI